MHLKALCILLLIAPLCGWTQSATPAMEIEAIRQTLPAFLDQHSIAGILPDGENFRFARKLLDFELEMSKGKKAKKKVQKHIEKLEFIADSIAQVLETKPIQVTLADTLFAFDYQPDSYSDLRKWEDWKATYDRKYREFSENFLVIFDTIIGVEYLELTKKQVDLNATNQPIELTALKDGRYEYVPNDSPLGDLTFRGVKIYKPVFNDDATKGCYLFSYVTSGSKELVTQFIFIEKQDGHWEYVEAWRGKAILGYD